MSTTPEIIWGALIGLPIGAFLGRMAMQQVERMRARAHYHERRAQFMRDAFVYQIELMAAQTRCCACGQAGPTTGPEHP